MTGYYDRMSDFKTRLRRWLKRMVIVLALFIVLPVGFYFYATWQGERELRAVLDELDANDAPWRWDDLLAARAPVAAEDDVRAIVLAVHAKVRGLAPKIDTQLNRRPNLLLGPEDAEPFSKEVAPLEVVLQQARKVAGVSKARFHVAWSKDPLGANLDDVQKAREFIYRLHVDAFHQAHHGDLESAMENCLAMQRLSQALQDEPGLITHLVRIAIQTIGLTSLERVLGHGQPSLEQLERLQRAWEGFDGERGLMSAFRGERAYSHWLFEAIAERKVGFLDAGANTKRADQWQEWQAFIGIYLRTGLKQSHAWTLRHWSAVLESLQLPEPERAGRHRQLEDDLQQAPGAAKFLMPAWVKVFDAHQRAEARTRCTIAALAAERFRQAQDPKRWPKALAELCPEFLANVPDDPYTGKPLQLRVADDGIVIYSVGLDGKQCGMHQENLAANRPNIQYEFRLWNVNQRRLVDPRQP